MQIKLIVYPKFYLTSNDNKISDSYQVKLSC